MASILPSRPAGDAGGDPPDDRFNFKKNKGPAFMGLSEAQKQQDRLRDMANWIDKNFNQVLAIKRSTFTREFCNRLLELYDEFGISIFCVKNKPHGLWMSFFSNVRKDMHSEYRPAHAPAVHGHQSFTPGGGNNYLPCIIAATVAGSRNNQPRCHRCRRGTMPYFTECVTVPGMFKGACLNCAWTNHYGNCSFAELPAPPSPSSGDSSDHPFHETLLNYPITSPPPPGQLRGTLVIPYNYDPDESPEQTEARLLALFNRIILQWDDTYISQRDGQPF